MSIASYLAAAPKAELHVHLEGSIGPATLLELAQRNRVDLPHTTLEGLKEWFVFRDFPHFVQVYGAISRCLRHSEDFEYITYEFGREMARQNIRYAEVTFSPFFHAYHGISQEAWFGGLLRGRARARREWNVDMRWTFDIIRGWRSADDQRYCNDYTLRVAIDAMGAGVTALGLGGFELGSPPEPFEPWFDRARAAGLRSAPHAGETDGSASIWGALRALGADRIGHGVRAIEDRTLLEHLADRRIPIEVSPTSNIRLGVFASLAEHPLPRLLEAGVPLSVNSDDPPLFGTTLTDELLLLADPFALEPNAIDAILLAPIAQSFLPDAERAALEARARADLDRLRTEHLGGSAPLER